MNNQPITFDFARIRAEELATFLTPISGNYDVGDHHAIVEASYQRFKSHRASDFKAGLKRAAEITFNESTKILPWYRNAERCVAERIEQAILKEAQSSG